MSRKTEFRNYPVPDENATPPESGSEAFLLLRSAVEAVDMDIQDVLDALNGKAGIEHHHQISDIEALQKALDEKMPGNRQFRLDDLNDVDGADTAPIGYVLVKTADGWLAQSALAAVGNHDHSMGQITGLTEALNLKQGTSGKGVVNGYASLGADGKVPAGQLPSLTTTATVGAALAGASGKAVPADGDRFAGVLAGASTVFHTTWGNIKAALAALFVNKAGDTMTGGLGFGNAVGASTVDLTRHISLYGGEYGFNVTNSTLNYVSGGHHYFRTNVGTENFRVESNGNVVARGTVYAGNGSAAMSTDGNVLGAAWGGGWLYDWIERRARDYADDRANGVRGEIWWRARDYLLGELVAVGGTALLQNLTGSTLDPGATLGGANLGWASCDGRASVYRVNYGTWQLCGYVGPYADSARYKSTSLWKRIG